MNREDVIRMAREAELINEFDTTTPWIEDHDLTPYLEHFFQAAYAAGAAAERRMCEALHQHEDVLAPVGNSAWGEAHQEGWAAGTAAYRDAIRARGQA